LPRDPQFQPREFQHNNPQQHNQSNPQQHNQGGRPQYQPQHQQPQQPQQQQPNLQGGSESGHDIGGLPSFITGGGAPQPQNSGQSFNQNPAQNPVKAKTATTSTIAAARIASAVTDAAIAARVRICRTSRNKGSRSRASRSLPSDGGDEPPRQPANKKD